MNYILSLIVFFSFWCNSSMAQEATSILDKIKGKYSEINDYEADVHVEVDVDFLNMPDKNVKVYYKKPDKFRMKAKGFAMLPKKGVNFAPTDFIQGDFTAINLGNSEKGLIIKIIPSDPESELILTTLWVDTLNFRINNVEANTKKSGSFMIEIKYGNLPMDMPEQIVVSFDIKDFEIPISLTGEYMKKEIKKAKKDETKGSVTLRYSNYKINQGIEDAVFLNKKDN